MALEWFPRGSHLLSSRGTELQLRCGPQRITFNKACTLLLSRASRVMLMWDKDEKKVAAKCTELLSGFNVTPNISSCQSYITCRTFLKATGLISAGLIQPIWNESEERLEWVVPS